MRPRSLLVFSSMLVLASACATASTTGGEGGDASGPGSGGTTTGGPTTGSNTTTGSGTTTTGSNTTSGTGGDATSTGSNVTSTGSNATSTSSGPVCAENPCKLTIPQCGCAAGEQCSLDAAGRACVPAGNTGNGQACVGPDCGPGLLCLETATNINTCSKFCDVDADCTAPGGLCIIGLNDGSGNPIPGVTMCTENCDPTTSIGCPAAGTGCQVGREPDGQKRFLTFCAASGAGQQGATCVDNSSCAPKFGCFKTSTGPDVLQCLKNCKASAPNGCPGVTTCHFFTTPELVGNEEYGACL